MEPLHSSRVHAALTLTSSLGNFLQGLCPNSNPDPNPNPEPEPKPNRNPNPEPEPEPKPKSKPEGLRANAASHC